MPSAIVQVLGPTGNWYVQAKPRGMLIGRQASCDIVLDSHHVSRNHARLYQDPFGRWVIEDSGSHNGVWIGGQQVQTAPVCPSERITIGPFSLMRPEEVLERLPADKATATIASVVDSSTAENLT